jgi:hypothetical protein
MSEPHVLTVEEAAMVSGSAAPLPTTRPVAATSR